MATLSISRPIIWGNTAKPFGEVRPAGAPDEHTHTWTVFVRGPNGEDLSYFIKKVVFKLHETYPNSTRSIETPPFEVTETGWGEFEIGIKIFFIPESTDKNISMYHHLRLHPYGHPQGTEITEEMRNVESIQYDEIVFNEPTEELLQIMTKKPGNIIAKTKKESKFSKETENEELARLDHGLKKVNLEIEKLKKKVQSATSA
ncbi:Protein AF-9 [Cyberlindnera fabianii]|uniref:Protein AF-9 homolog n=1 Tax=Cyberlindnera fabianii TaxID=36022 RepID=A0A1V2LC18_CYBFA|nr:Protein AF-9 [Cyberlindnera fabianii]